MKKPLRLLLALLAALALFATACGSDSVSDAVDSASDAASDAVDAVEDAVDGDDDAMDDEDAMADDEDAMADDAMADSDTSVGLVYDIGGRGDLSFNDSAAAGLERADAELGIPFGEASPNDDGSNRAELLQLAADANDIVVGVGFLFAGDAAAVAAENPDTNFAVIDDAMIDIGTGDPLAPNAAGLTFAEEEGSFLVGAAAALKSETGTIGFIGGVCCFGLIEKFEAGYIAGAKSVNPDITIISEYITEAPDFDGFNQPDRAQVIATTMYEDGADVIYHAAGGAGNGMFQAAKDFSEDNGSKVWGIGVDSDQYNTIGAVDESLQEYVLTSMLKRVDVAVFEILKAQQSGTFAAGNTVYDLSVDGVGYSTTGGYVDDIADQLEDFKSQIASGAIVVPTVPGEAVTEGEPVQETSVGLVYDIGGRGDLSFNDSAAAGLERADAELGIPFGEASPNDDGSNRAELLQLAADANDIVVGVGFLFAGDAAAVAAENPDTNFAVIDDAMIDIGTGDPLAPNAAGLTFAEEEGSFLVGAAAALKSETGTIGFIGGVCCFGLIEKFEAGYIAGAKSVNPDITIISEYITEAPDFDGFNQPDRAQVIATTMYEDGADVIYHAAGGAGNGMFQAAKDFSEDNGSKVWGIGVDSDQYNTIGAVDESLQEYVLTSMLKRVDVAVFEILKAQQSGTFAAGNTVYDLSVDGVGYSTTGGYVDDIADQLEELKASIVAGDITVPTDPTEAG